MTQNIDQKIRGIRVIRCCFSFPNASVDHNVYIVGSYAYESNYSSGLQILSLSDVANGNLSQVAFFDTYPANNNPSYNGSWSNYPFYDSGVVAVSGIDEGLFILKPMLEMGVLETSRGVIEESAVMGESVTQTLTISNTGNISFTFTASEGAAWAAVSPSGGTLNPGEAIDLSVVFDSSATAGPGDYTDALSFSGTFDNAPDDVDLIFHVLEPADYYSYIPMVAGNGGGIESWPVGAAVLWLLPLVGVMVGVGYGRRRGG